MIRFNRLDGFGSLNIRCQTSSLVIRCFHEKCSMERRYLWSNSWSLCKSPDGNGHVWHPRHFFQINWSDHQEFHWFSAYRLDLSGVPKPMRSPEAVWWYVRSQANAVFCLCLGKVALSHLPSNQAEYKHHYYVRLVWSHHPGVVCLAVRLILFDCDDGSHE